VLVNGTDSDEPVIAAPVIVNPAGFVISIDPRVCVGASFTTVNAKVFVDPGGTVGGVTEIEKHFVAEDAHCLPVDPLAEPAPIASPDNESAAAARQLPAIPITRFLWLLPCAEGTPPSNDRTDFRCTRHPRRYLGAPAELAAYDTGAILAFQTNLCRGELFGTFPGRLRQRPLRHRNPRSLGRVRKE
jgi:hypothetical protein